MLCALNYLLIVYDAHKSVLLMALVRGASFAVGLVRLYQDLSRRLFSTLAHQHQNGYCPLKAMGGQNPSFWHLFLLVIGTGIMKIYIKITT